MDCGTLWKVFVAEYIRFVTEQNITVAVDTKYKIKCHARNVDLFTNKLAMVLSAKQDIFVNKTI